MAITVELWTFTKTTNSTKQPSGTVTKSISCTMKDECSIMRPVLETQDVTTPWIYNYAKIPTFGNRYYFIDDWSYYRGVWSCEMTEDVLATYKTSIGSSYQLVTRTANATYWNKYLVDDTYPAIGEPSVYAVSNPLSPDVNPYVTDIRNGCYVIGITNNDSQKTYGGSVTYYVLDYFNLNMLKGYLMDFNNWSSIDASITNLQKFEFNPLQYIVSCNYFPFGLSDMPRTHYEINPAGILEYNAVYFGWWTTPTIVDADSNTFKMWSLGSKPIGTKSGYLNIPKHPQAATRGKYLNLDPYSRYTLVFRPFGEIALDSTFLVDLNAIYYTIKFDAITGEAILELFMDSTAQTNDIPFATYRSQLATPVQLSQITQDVVGAVQGVVSMVSSFASFAAGSGAKWTEMNGLVGTKGVSAGSGSGPISSIIDGTISACRSMIPQMTSVGNNGSYLEYDYTPRVFAQCFQITDDAHAKCGYASYEYMTVNSSSGFTLCKDVKIELSAMSEEIDLIKQYMEAGFYYE